MAAAKEIRNKIRSVQSTQKITKAMEMVAASKMRKSQELVLRSRPYSEQISKVINDLAHATSEYKHPYLSAREVRRVGYIIVSTDRGLCGGLNINLFKNIIDSMEQYSKQGVEVNVCLIGFKSEVFFRKFGAKVLGNINYLGDKPSLQDLVGVLKLMLDAYDEVNIDKLYICYNQFVNNMTYRPQITQLLPVEISEEPSKENGYSWDYLYEPDPKILLDLLLVRYLESQVYQSVVENLACEQAARRMAMKAASDNAKELIDKLRLQYNKARQAAITQELSEIVSGAAAVY